MFDLPDTSGRRVTGVDVLADEEFGDGQASSDSSFDLAAADSAHVFDKLAEIIYQGSNIDEVYTALCIAATLIVPGCHHASLLIRRAGRYVTAAASDWVAMHIDDIERSTGEGPCVDTIDEGSPQIEPDLTNPRRWPTFADRVIAETPVRGAMGFRVLVDEHKIGALNLFSDKPNVFDIEIAGHATVLASFASVALHSVNQGEDIASMRRGVHGNREIGKALGMLRGLYQNSQQEAFGMLRQYTQDVNTKVVGLGTKLLAAVEDAR